MERGEVEIIDYYFDGILCWWLVSAYITFWGKGCISFILALIERADPTSATISDEPEPGRWLTPPRSLKMKDFSAEDETSPPAGVQ